MSTSEICGPIINDQGQLVDSEGYLIPIDYSAGGAITDFINVAENILKQFSEYDAFTPEFEFRKLDVYGSVEKPLFSGSYIYKYVKPKGADISRFYNIFRKNEKSKNRYLVYHKTKIFQRNKSKKDSIKDEYTYKNQDAILFTEIGLMKAIFTEDNDFALTFQDLIITFIKNIRSHHRNIFNQELQRAHDKVSKELKEAYKENDKLSKKNFVLASNNDILNHARDFFDMPELRGDDNVKELQTLQYIYYTPVSLYVVHYDYVIDKYTNEKKKNVGQKKKGPIVKKKSGRCSRRKLKNINKESNNSLFAENGMSDSDNDSVCDTPSKNMDMDDIDDYDPNEEAYEDPLVSPYVMPFAGLTMQDSISSSEANDDMYYFIDNFDKYRSSKYSDPEKESKLRSKYIIDILDNSTKLFDIPYYDKEHYNEAMSILTKDKDNIAETVIPKVYRTSLTHIMGARNDTFINKHQPDFKKILGCVKYSATKRAK